MHLSCARPCCSPTPTPTPTLTDLTLSQPPTSFFISTYLLPHTFTYSTYIWTLPLSTCLLRIIISLSTSYYHQAFPLVDHRSLQSYLIVLHRIILGIVNLSVPSPLKINYLVYPRYQRGNYTTTVVSCRSYRLSSRNFTA